MTIYLVWASLQLPACQRKSAYSAVCPSFQGCLCSLPARCQWLALELWQKQLYCLLPLNGPAAPRLAQKQKQFGCRVTRLRWWVCCVGYQCRSPPGYEIFWARREGKAGWGKILSLLQLAAASTTYRHKERVNVCGYRVKYLDEYYQKMNFLYISVYQF